MKLHNGKGRRILSSVLCLLMVLALLPAAALAEEFLPYNGTVTNNMAHSSITFPKLGIRQIQPWSFTLMIK